jgi:hypothetical protein
MITITVSAISQHTVIWDLKWKQNNPFSSSFMAPISKLCTGTINSVNKIIIFSPLSVAVNNKTKKENDYA